MNLRHPMIAPLICWSYPQQSNGFLDFQMVRLYANDGSLADVLLNRLVWWTRTAKAKTIVGIAFGFRSAHGFGLLHGSVKARNIIFDQHHRIQIADFSRIRLENGSVELFSGDNWAPTLDISGFISLLSDIVIGHSVSSFICSNEDPLLRSTIPDFVWEIINHGRSTKSQNQLSFIDIIDSLKENDFRIMSGVDYEEVSKFVTWAESSGQSGGFKQRHRVQIIFKIPCSSPLN
jgi:hypothetical protein